MFKLLDKEWIDFRCQLIVVVLLFYTWGGEPAARGPNAARVNI